MIGSLSSEIARTRRTPASAELRHRSVPHSQGAALTHEPYARFASAYDTNDHGAHSHAFFERCQPLLQDVDPKGPVLDLGCGTGVLTVALAARGYRTVGVDRSSRMLTIARRRCHAYRGLVTFKRADLTAFKVRTPASAAIACADVVNHLSPLGSVTAMFRRTSESLQSSGVFVFDTLRRTCFERAWADHTYFMEGEGGDLVMECGWDPKQRVGNVRIVAYEKRLGGAVRKRETTLREYLYSDREIRDALRSTGFEKIQRQPWDPWAGCEPDAAILDRNFWIAYKH